MRIKISLIIASIFISGCANFNSIHRDLNIDDGEGALIDIKQRAIFVSKHIDGSGATRTERTIVCAEPSPDSLSAYAAELAAEASTPEKTSGKIAAAFQESSSFVGLRTQSIQLLRDSLYRLCEGYMSGALDKPNYDILVRRYQKYMVALLAIEQLTGTVKVPAIVINTQGSAEAAQSISTLRDQISSIDTKIAKIEDNKKEQVTKKGEDGITDDKKKEIDKIISGYDKNIAQLKSDKDVVNKAIENAKGLAVTGTATATVSVTGMQSQRSDEHIQAIAATVEKIVSNILNTDDTGQLCWAYLRDGSTQETALGKSCLAYISNKNKENAIFLEVQEKKLKFNNSDNEAVLKILNDVTKNIEKNKSGWQMMNFAE